MTIPLDRAGGRNVTGVVPVTATLIGTIALQTAVPPFATDMYTPAFPRVTADLSTTASLIGLTLTAFFLGFAAGQLTGGPWSDQAGRRTPLIVGGLVCMLGALGCALAPTVWVLVVARIVQGVGGGIAAAVARAVVVDVARGDLLARVMSILQALGGLAPMIAPVIGALVITVSTWRTVFWVLTGLGATMALTAVWFIPETLAPERRHAGGLRRSASGITEVLRSRLFIGYMLTATFSGFTMMGYIANSSYVLQEMKGLAPITFSLFFASTALSQVLLSILNARLIGRVRPRTLIAAGLISSSAAVTVLTVGVLALNTPLILTCAGFLVLMASQAFVFGNAGALAALEVPHIAGAAAAVQGVAGALAMATSAPLASAGGGRTALPMIAVMLVGALIALGSFTLISASRGWVNGSKGQSR
ncbi:MAG TPA: Bcr/CflA family efflux MFS transporter [Propionibacteriaceae bacterium]|nr:Bcr/CflA family efflux MFS transporter [Propionibacteriaceae bacterium]